MTQEAAVPASWKGQIQKWIDAAVAKALRSAPQRNSSITGEGGLTIRGGGNLTVDDGGNLIVNGGQLRVLYPGDEGGGVGVYFGDTLAVGTGAYTGTGVLIQDADGSDIATFRSDVSGHPLAIIRDGQGNGVFYTDTATGQGIVRPYVPGVFYRQRYLDWVSTTAAAFEGLHKAEVFKQHPRMSVAVQVAIDDPATTGELRVMVNGAQLGSTASLPYGVGIRLFGPDAVAGTHGQLLTVEIQARRTAGAGTVRVEPLHIYGR